ncbi:preprotein translocase subunit SecY [Clostridium novyi B str. ATCC 27606]|uniref:Protein translocase subunit SecY n=2 Tax=Clostridium TaxID=1485 RepID=A0A9P2LKM6_CLOBO|nr:MULTISPECIES: preprotein translocase subunit SecY [Clostridium]AYF53739.1 preprotein translocase subunit SecY [Clostridium novyi]EES90610.1 preprotein translocase, SecY subunit [Clostridium botulinum D str. 1873]KEI11256.1 preprotein translocase subunit SecY [Clostridium novyi B str. NCTC 9691]KEI18346.1 preprotein translocase subunit SecY [Clostridium novyi B str. ATCC 27606]MBO3442098.1 preprotein translocase subunit SecY [Clostridium haemolyticum]
MSTLRNAWKVPELRKKILFTLFMVAIIRMGNHIPVPGIDTGALANITKAGTLFSFYDLMSGGALSNFSIFAMGVIPYINSSIIFQLLTIAIPSLEQLSKEGEEGRKKIQKYTRYTAIVLGALQSFGTYALIRNQGVATNLGKFDIFLMILTLTTASTFLMWLGDQITVKGIGNGISLIIFVNIISRLPEKILKINSLQQNQSVSIVQVIFLIVFTILMFTGVVIATLAERRIPIQYAAKNSGGRMLKGQSTHIPINMNSSAIIAIIFAMSVMQFPTTIGSFWPESAFNKFITMSKYSVFKMNTWPYAVITAILVIFFTWFYTEVTFKPDEMAENIHKSAGFVPGVRPGEATARFIEKVLVKVSILGGIFATVIALIPMVFESVGAFKGISLGGTALLIEVGVALDFMRVLESQLVMRHYKGFLK